MYEIKFRGKNTWEVNNLKIKSNLLKEKHTRCTLTRTIIISSREADTKVFEQNNL